VAKPLQEVAAEAGAVAPAAGALPAGGAGDAPDAAPAGALVAVGVAAEEPPQAATITGSGAMIPRRSTSRRLKRQGLVVFSLMPPLSPPTTVRLLTNPHQTIKITLNPASRTA